MKITLALALALVCAGFARAQTDMGSWSNLKQLRPGEKIEVVDSHLKKVKGKFVSFTDEAISLQDGKQELSVVRADVMRVSARDTSHRTRNMLIGAAIGGGAALTIGLLANSSARNEGTGCDACVAGFAAAATGGGAALGAIPRFRTIYRMKR